jgi:hypothetical protein
MKTFFRSLLLAAALVNPAFAQTNLPGTWHGRLEVAPGKTIVIHFVIAAEPGGKYSAVLTSPEDGAIKDVRAGSVKYADNRLTVDVPALSGGYAGTLRNGAFEGEWTQEGTKLPLTLRPFEAQALKKADLDTLRGEWFGKYRNMGLDVMIILRFSAGADGAARAVLDIPEQGVKDWETKNLELDDGHFSVEIPAAMTRITGTLKGGEIVGQWVQFGNSTPLTLKKGRYVAAPTYLDLPAAAREQLKGKWSGTLGPLTVVMRFETDAQGRTLGFFDSPQQNLPNVPISEAKLDGTKFTIGIAGFGAKFSGELADGKLTGEWIQPGMPKPAPLVLTRAK